MIRAFDGKAPRIAASAFVSEWAYVVGDVEIGDGTGVWPGAVVRGDFGPIRIGKNCQIEDNAVLHTGDSLTIGDNVIIGHGAVIHGVKIGDGVLVGNSATILDGAEVGDHCIIGANSLVATGQKVPSHSLAVGVPARVKVESSPGSMQQIHRRLSHRYPQLTELSYTDLARRYKDQGL